MGKDDSNKDGMKRGKENLKDVKSVEELENVKNVESVGEKMVLVDVIFYHTVSSVDSQRTNALVCSCTRKFLIFLKGARDNQEE